ncbi:MAG: hypothetical protein JWM11_1994, partial [Planctomycetaceae bacterium]|nr:hypothetical protein [Planctomycetaceae bacterium]
MRFAQISATSFALGMVVCIGGFWLVPQPHRLANAAEVQNSKLKDLYSQRIEALKKV